MVTPRARIQSGIADFGFNDSARGNPDDPSSRLADADPVLRRLVRSIGNYSLRTHEDGWGVLVAAVIHQQVSGQVAATICRRLTAANSGRIPHPSEILAQDLRRFGLTQRKEETIKALAGAILRSELSLAELLSCEDDDVEAILTAWKGVGPWTANMWLVFHAGRTDIILPGDLGLRKAIQTHYARDRMPSATEVVTIAEGWRPWRTIATWYLWKSVPGFPEPGFSL